MSPSDAIRTRFRSNSISFCLCRFAQIQTWLHQILLHQPDSPSFLVSTMAAAEMARYATEQPSVATDSSLTAQNADVEMAANATEHRLQVISAGTMKRLGNRMRMEYHAVQADRADNSMENLCFLFWNFYLKHFKRRGSAMLQSRLSRRVVAMLQSRPSRGRKDFMPKSRTIPSRSSKRNATTSRSKRLQNGLGDL